MEEQYTRRKFLKHLWHHAAAGGSALFLSGALLAGCESDSEPSDDNSNDPLNVESCDDLSKVTDAELKKRKGFGYVEKSPMPDKQCSNCNLYIPPKENQKCGSCILFEGPVFEEAYCTYWAPTKS